MSADHPDGVIVIEHGAAPHYSGFVPFVRVNGRLVTSGWAPPVGEDEAKDCARAIAEYEASHYVGDWSISISEAP